MTIDTRPVDLQRLTEQARQLRRDIIRMTTAAGSGHPSSSLSMVEVLTALYFGGVLRHDPARPDWRERDRFVLSKGHAAPGLYATLAEAGYFPVEELMTLRRLGSPLEGHPNMRKVPGVEASTGSLGQGLSIALGHALAARLDGLDYRVFVLLGDGEIDEGQVWEASMAASHFHLDRLIAVVDHNQYQQTAAIEQVMDSRPLGGKWRAFGWHVDEIDGHDLMLVLKTLEAARAGYGRPALIVARTVKGKGVSFIEGGAPYHGKALTPEQAEAALQEIG